MNEKKESLLGIARLLRSRIFPCKIKSGLDRVSPYLFFAGPRCYAEETK
jgi:hypothetical protein